MDILLLILAGVGIMALIVVMFLTILWCGFRMGRRTVDHPLPPIVKQKVVNMVEEDPWYKPMTGEDQPSYPTIEEGSR